DGIRDGHVTGVQTCALPICFSAKDSTGALQATSITLTTTNAGSLDAAISAINTQLQSNSTLKNVVAVKELNKAGTAEGIRFVSRSEERRVGKEWKWQ